MKDLTNLAMLGLPTFDNAFFDQGVVGLGKFCVHRGFCDEVADER